MRNVKIGFWALAALLTTGCVVAPAVDNPYESCVPGDNCTNGTLCMSTSLPSSTGYTGNLCSNACNTTADCVQDVTSFSATCVNGVCYLQCPPSGQCPYGTGCLTFSDQNGVLINLCTP